MGRKSAHLKLGTGQRRLGEEKSKQLKGPLWLQEYGKLLLCCQLLFVVSEVFLCLYTIAFIHADGIYNWQCFPFTGVTAAEAIAAAIDNLREITRGFENELLKQTFNKYMNAYYLQEQSHCALFLKEIPNWLAWSPVVQWLTVSQQQGPEFESSGCLWCVEITCFAQACWDSFPILWLPPGAKTCMLGEFVILNWFVGMIVNGCLPLCLSPVIDWWPVPLALWQQWRALTRQLPWIYWRKWMDGS